MKRKVGHGRHVKKRVKQNLIGDIVSAAGGAGQAAMNFMGGVAQSAAPYVAPAAAAATVVGGVLIADALGLSKGGGSGSTSTPRPKCPPGYVMTADGNCYPTGGGERIVVVRENNISDTPKHRSITTSPGSLAVPLGLKGHKARKIKRC
jgi:hypothetical protein